MGHRAERALVRGLAISFVVAGACGGDPPTVVRLASDGFETRCGSELPCGWEQVAGADGQARYETTFHPGDHGLLLEGGGVTVRGPGGSGARSAIFTVGSLRAQLAARCDAGNMLTIDVGIVDASSASPRFVDSLEGRSTPPARWEDSPFGVVLTSPTALAEGGLGMASGYSVRVTSVTITQTGSGRCEISDIQIDDVTGFSTPSISCSG